jgi:hypothetical protein
VKKIASIRDDLIDKERVIKALNGINLNKKSRLLKLKNKPNEVKINSRAAGSIPGDIWYP